MKVSLEIPDEWREELKDEIIAEVTAKIEEKKASDDVLDVKEAAKILGLSKQSVYRIIKNYPDFPHMKIGKTTKILKSRLFEWLKKKDYVYISDFDGNFTNKSA